MDDSRAALIMPTCSDDGANVASNDTRTPRFVVCVVAPKDATAARGAATRVPRLSGDGDAAVARRHTRHDQRRAKKRGRDAATAAAAVELKAAATFCVFTLMRRQRDAEIFAKCLRRHPHASSSHATRS